jgi:hypothetical protein
MKSLFVGLAALIGVSLVASPAEARPRKGTVVIVETPAPVAPVQTNAVQGNKVKHQHKPEQEAFKQAVKDGRITKQEAKRLKMEKTRIHQMKQVAAADGVVTPKEQRQLRKARQRFEQDKQQAIENDKTRG